MQILPWDMQTEKKIKECQAQIQITINESKQAQIDANSDFKNIQENLSLMTRASLATNTAISYKIPVSKQHPETSIYRSYDKCSQLWGNHHLRPRICATCCADREPKCWWTPENDEYLKIIKKASSITPKVVLIKNNEDLILKRKQVTTCRFCGGRGHWTNDSICNNKHIKCSRYGKKGHWANKCPEWKPEGDFNYLSQEALEQAIAEAMGNVSITDVNKSSSSVTYAQVQCTITL